MTRQKKTYPELLAARPPESLHGLERSLAATTRPRKSQRKFASHGELLATMPEGSLTGLDRAKAAAYRRAHPTA